MLLSLTHKLDIGIPSKQRLIFEVTRDGNLWGHFVYQGKKHLAYAFPPIKVSKGDFVILYLSPGDNATKKIMNETCHFLYLNRWIHLWEEQTNPFQLVYKKI